MWSYYGSKANIVDLYPKPLYNKVIEPFAGSARYALKYFDREVLLVDKYDVIVKIWQWLQKCSPNDIKGLPRFKAGDNINDVTYDCQEARFLVGFLVGFGFTTPRDTATPRLRHRPNAMEYTINKIANDLFKIRHWKIRSGSYEDIPNQEATWFFDPPYQDGGHIYKFGNKKIDFNSLGDHCKSRLGQVIVCEKVTADWLNFVPLKTQFTHNGKQSEGIWTNYHTHFNNVQQTLAL